ncbi:hypothetical protein C491_11793 [Natronococcus amylolyticus DSM 10524]|uniref:DUF305 domain-containing protein n=1 Tax=Natronococcus amylolyticus DSM 10524 TaxID=1227497 RepID=L9X6E5_9EURY|nr:DUF305 domain-containing protein [Natronococcus amylolyticus]ELY57182.1 hypothetical protein C491_11793 [Natronococcus amylolyticus DSM 10524]
MRRVTRRRILYATGATGAIGLTGFATASEDEDEHDGTDHGEHHDDDHDHHEEHGEHIDFDEDSEFNEADVMFMQGMIPHHEQAIEMAELIPGRSDSRELCELGPEIIDVQQAEIEQLHEWLREAGVDDPEEHEMDHEEMDGMLTEEDFQELRESEGQEFDCLFAEHMIVHHDGAIMMSEHVLEEGASERVADLADEIIDVQQEEIEMMECWKDRWNC